MVPCMGMALFASLGNWHEVERVVGLGLGSASQTVDHSGRPARKVCIEIDWDLIQSQPR